MIIKALLRLFTTLGMFSRSLSFVLHRRNLSTNFVHDGLRVDIGLRGTKFYRRKCTMPLLMDLGKFLNNAFGMGGDNDDDESKRNQPSSIGKSGIDSEEYGYVGCSNIFKIKAKSLKVGGCRLYLSLFLVGEVNSPDKGTWRMDQNEDGGIDLYYKDATGAMMIMFHDDEITVNRIGSAPSMNYLMSETSLVNGMLDQLDDIAFDTSIEEKDRLILLHEPGDAIDNVRESLSFN